VRYANVADTVREAFGRFAADVGASAATRPTRNRIERATAWRAAV
jgi:hypothetical protein